MKLKMIILLSLAFSIAMFAHLYACCFTCVDIDPGECCPEDTGCQESEGNYIDYTICLGSKDICCPAFSQTKWCKTQTMACAWWNIFSDPDCTEYLGPDSSTYTSAYGWMCELDERNACLD